MQSDDESNNRMFAIYSRQPLHKTLVQFRVISIILIFFCLWLIHDMWEWFKTKVELLGNSWDVAFWGFAGIVIGIVWKAIQNIQDSHSVDKD